MISYADAFPTMSVSPTPKFSGMYTTREFVDCPDDTKAMTWREMKEWLNGLKDYELDGIMLVQMGRLVFAWGRPITYEYGGPATFNPILVETKTIIHNPSEHWKELLKNLKKDE
jgi:hypothetical protein